MKPSENKAEGADGTRDRKIMALGRKINTKSKVQRISIWV